MSSLPARPAPRGCAWILLGSESRAAHTQRLIGIPEACSQCGRPASALGSWEMVAEARPNHTAPAGVDQMVVFRESMDGN